MLKWIKRIFCEHEFVYEKCKVSDHGICYGNDFAVAYFTKCKHCNKRKVIQRLMSPSE